LWQVEVEVAVFRLQVAVVLAQLYYQHLHLHLPHLLIQLLLEGVERVGQMEVLMDQILPHLV
jgi:hypothetical protein